jgi:hypothetical protein
VGVLGDGSIAPPPPGPSVAQQWADIAKANELIGDALVYFIRGSGLTSTRQLNVSRTSVRKKAFRKCRGSPHRTSPPPI